jgi:tRNA threonylcarbamoyladenosine modification (KEOPS) complex  Pcc1 subunit
MKATFEIGFADEKQAKVALAAIAAGEAPSKRSVMHVSHRVEEDGSATIIYELSADSFPALRARATSLLRDVKACKDALAVAKR